ncbi:hypothetical protein VOLCADRAFT_91327 [Volvox carteri f. nagariensis]|uniref:Fucolectin tachylectin-4 pentraxin-1 domain-containing protein n=1 Tax=Volvox carteri f. nagariensis TaxID=3068 RepID=D8TWS3_VOLCA|nr:uncharacterized protein VOLCADRAFT_91327 [Volvox carteri f. nagariensis]EFJ48199.1 hypothetical protein VOLCADRAFT_91327 [Volvox carteri f. nagariensis]|eukprot:XP_002950884.1 hypothetical protein VOLCADRAFT_91327 [Volvox carteri f. nagariensis]
MMKLKTGGSMERRKAASSCWEGDWYTSSALMARLPLMLVAALMMATCATGDDDLPNLALRQAVYASSVYYQRGNTYDPGYAVDGVTEYPSPLDKYNVSLFSSKISDSTPWISVDLGAVALVKRVVIINRRDCCQDQLRNAELRIGNVSITNAAGGGDTRNITGNPLVWQQDAGTYINASATIPFDTPKVGRWVTLQIKQPTLHITEIQVFGYYAASAVCANVLPGTTYGTEASTITILKMQSSGDCCSACSVNPDCRYWVFRRCKNTCTLKRDEGAGPGFFIDEKTVAGGVRPVALFGTPRVAIWRYKSFVDPEAQWIWSRGSAAQFLDGVPENPPTTFSYVYRAASAVTANISVGTNSNAWIYINGMQMNTSIDYFGIFISSLSVTLQKGPNLIQILVQNTFDGSSAGVVMSFRNSSGRVLARSNASWVWSERAIIEDRVCVQPQQFNCLA